MADTILLSPVGGRAIHGLAQYFRAQGDRTIGIDINPDAVGRHFVDRFESVPRNDEPGYAEHVLALLEQEKPALFISWLDSDLLFWNRAWQEGRISAHLLPCFTMQFREDLAELLDKQRFAARLEALGLPTPRTVSLAEARQLSLPAFLKPITGSGSRGVRRIDDWAELPAAGDYLLQPLLTGQEYTIDLFAQRGRLVNHAIRIRHQHQGVSLLGEVVPDAAISALAVQFAEKLGLDGVHNFQCMRDAAGALYITDFNPRPSGTLMLTITAGVDLLQNLRERAQGRPITPFGEAKPLKMVRYLTEHYYG